MRTSGINHVSIHAVDLSASVAFYVELLEASLLDTPNFGVPVQWLGLGASQLHVFVRPAVAQSHHHFGITVEDLEPVYRRASALGALDGRAHGNYIIELPGDVAQTYVRDPAGNLMEIDTPGASRLPAWLRAEMKPLGALFPQDDRNLRGRLYVPDPAGAT
ncbi:MAG TPA: VOC family protein [Solirubrobacter sp.]|nr:VOC family protein [Solirubrobacter sp.]